MQTLAHTQARQPSQVGAYLGILIYVWPLLATLTVVVVLIAPELLLPVIVLDLWLLGYHHVIATYTRTSFSVGALRSHWFLNFALPPLMLALVVGIVAAGGVIALTTVYLHWQLFHYVRQSEGISKSVAQPGADRAMTQDWAFRTAFYLTPATAFLTMSQAGDQTFLGMPIALLVLPTAWLSVLWTLCGAAIVLTLLRHRSRAPDGRLHANYRHYVFSHFYVFVVAYGLFRDVTLSWLFANIWHNGQYLTFVWKANQKSYSESARKPALQNKTVISVISQPGNLALYFGATLTLTFLIYYLLQHVDSWVVSTLAITPLVATAILYQTVNFHHYVVDAIIWRRPRPAPHLSAAPLSAAGAATAPSTGLSAVTRAR